METSNIGDRFLTFTIIDLRLLMINYMFIFILFNLSLALPEYYHSFDEINLGKYSDCAKIETLLDNPKIDVLTINEQA